MFEIAVWVSLADRIHLTGECLPVLIFWRINDLLAPRELSEGSDGHSMILASRRKDSPRSTSRWFYGIDQTKDIWNTDSL